MSTWLVVLSAGLTHHIAPQSLTSNRPAVLGRRAPDVLCQQQQREVTVSVEATLDDQKVKSLFAWLNMAFSGNGRYNNLMLAFAAIFGTHEPGSQYVQLVEDAMSQLPEGDDTQVGEPFSLRERERGSLGAMGAAQQQGVSADVPGQRVHGQVLRQPHRHADAHAQHPPRCGAVADTSHHSGPSVRRGA